MRSLEIKSEHFKSLKTGSLKRQVKEQIPGKYIFKRENKVHNLKVGL